MYKGLPSNQQASNTQAAYKGLSSNTKDCDLQNEWRVFPQKEGVAEEQYTHQLDSLNGPQYECRGFPSRVFTDDMHRLERASWLHLVRRFPSSVMVTADSLQSSIATIEPDRPNRSSYMTDDQQILISKRMLIF